MNRRLLKLGGLPLALATCSGEPATEESRGETTGVGDELGEETTGDESSTPDDSQLCDDVAHRGGPGRRVLRRLTAGEYDRSVRAIFELDPQSFASAQLPPDPAAENGFNNNTDRLLVGTAFARSNLSAAKRVGNLVAEPTWLDLHLACWRSGDRACAETFIRTYGERSFRRPLSNEEQARYLNLYDEMQSAGDDFATWVKWATAGLLQSPLLLYRSELGQQDGASYPLTDYEIATALAYSYTGAPPDEALRAQAQAGELTDPATRLQTARGLAFDGGGQPRPGFSEQMQVFFDQWLGTPEILTVAKDPIVYPGFSPEVARSMLSETRTYVRTLVFDEAATMPDLLRSDQTFVDDHLTHYYGFGPGTPGEFRRTQRPDTWGRGLLAQGSWLAIYGVNDATSPTQRGMQVRERFLCEHLPPPSAIIPELPDATLFNTTRERYEEGHAKDPACAGCHRLTDPIGFGLEHMGSDGRYRANENGYPIDDSGVVAGRFEGEIDRNFVGMHELAEVLAESRKPSDCVASFMAGHVFGLNHDEAACRVEAEREHLNEAKQSLLEYYLGLSASQHFAERR